MTTTDHRNEMEMLQKEAGKDAVAPEQSFSIRGRMIFGTLLMSSVFLGVGGWAATAELSGAVVASGSVVVEKNVKKVQHRDGGIVTKIYVRNGDRVSANQVILELDDTQIRAELAIIRAQLIELIARKSRQSALIRNASELTFPEDFEGSSPRAAAIAAAEREIFSETRANINGQLEQIESQIDQLNDEISGIQAQQSAKKKQLKLVRSELKKVEYLYRKALTSVTRVYALQREEQRLQGESGGLVAQVSRSKGRISELKLQMLSVKQASRLEAQREQSATVAKIAELSERAVAVEDRLSRTKLVAPQDGVVHEMVTHTIGGVISAAETALVIVPANDRLTIEVQIAPVNIDQVNVGRDVRLRFSAFHQETTPEFEGRVVHISADVTTDAQSGQSYYLGRVEVSPSEESELSKLVLVPGMPVEVYISTSSRTVLSYLAKPLTDQFTRAFREE